MIIETLPPGKKVWILESYKEEKHCKHCKKNGWVDYFYPSEKVIEEVSTTSFSENDHNIFYKVEVLGEKSYSPKEIFLSKKTAQKECDKENDKYGQIIAIEKPRKAKKSKKPKVKKSIEKFANMDLED